MSGHSKWATTKHRKAAVDKARAKVFAKVIRQLEVAAREGGGDINANATLRTMFEKARAASVPLDTIERAIKRGTGELEGVHYEEVSYEGYAPGGVAIIVECLTDNRNRTGAEVRNVFSRNGGSMAEPGAVGWQFARKGVVTLPKSIDEDAIVDVAVEAGAEDVSDEGDHWLVTSAPHDLAAVRDALDGAGMTAETAELAMVPSTTVPVTEESEVRKVLRLLEALDDHDDVQNVWSNFDTPDEVLAAAAAD
ncbi:MAG TPA: YebC/PmpR family DNA-binding transcriptional regulator [Acidimicrobiales bacterium]|nr:YebC/PmpR family DNA-binding transcriptional regulator [Acidimicrobiales bacterium]